MARTPFIKARQSSSADWVFKMALNRNLKAVIDQMSDEELATKFVMMTSETTRVGKLYSAQDLLDELKRRVGPVMLQVKLQEAREVFKMVGVETWDGR